MKFTLDHPGFIVRSKFFNQDSGFGQRHALRRLTAAMRVSQDPDAPWWRLRDGRRV
ncbi:MAG: hypothetical protein OSB11_12375 [Gammaproteobacteria bacterium]|nr:hypothetical protein [Gammaproteobacteria bacterium]